MAEGPPTVLAGVRTRVFERVDALSDDLVALTVDLVRIPTVNPPGDAYTPCAELVGRYLERLGFTIAYIRAEGTPGDSDRYPRTNIIARWESGRPGPTIHFNSHIDVVEAGQGWTKDPWGGEVSDGRVWGRGTCDMKGGLAASIIAAQAIIAEGVAICGAIEISGTVDEESGGFGGVAFLAKRGYFSRPRVDHVIIPEPLNPDRVCLGHRGVWWAEIETKGRIAHGSMPFLGVSAIRHMGAVLDAFERDLLPRLDNRQTAMPVVPPGARASTLNCNSLHGGQPEGFDGLPSPCVADSCRMVIDRRFLIEEPLDQVRGEVIDILERLRLERPHFAYSIRDLMTVHPVMTDAHAPVVRALDEEIAAVLGRASTHIASPGTYDQKHIARIGQLHDCVAYGPGILELAHQPDEWVGIADMVASAKIMAGACLRLAGVASPK
ncbi:MAG: acetylornithine deacetylase/succinyl-diaminopimelate desuccinylase family protein [Alphaproteobacteria bacterium]|nr:acetylornithine deacetylase/succinyl-diaminopimelate desuccinylase family protein [Alphaproteobacteria bacterium]